MWWIWRSSGRSLQETDCEDSTRGWARIPTVCPTSIRCVWGWGGIGGCLEGKDGSFLHHLLLYWKYILSFRDPLNILFRNSIVSPQDLPNNMIHQVPIKSLPQEWLWCETWCDDASKAKAKTIDLVLTACFIRFFAKLTFAGSGSLNLYNCIVYYFGVKTIHLLVPCGFHVGHKNGKEMWSLGTIRVLVVVRVLLFDHNCWYSEYL